MPFNRLNKLSPIGIDLGIKSFKAVQLTRVGTAWEICSAISLARTDPTVPLTSTEITRLTGVLDRRGFVGQDVIVAIPAACLLTSMLELPARAPGVPIEQIAEIEFARVHKQEPIKLTMSTWELPAPARAGKATYMLAVGAVSSQIETHIDLIESQGLNVVAIDEPFSAAARGALHLSAPATGLTSVIDLGWDAGRLTIVKSSQVIYTRKLTDAGLQRLYKKIQEATSAPDELVEEALWHFGFSLSTQAGPDQTDVLDELEDHFSGVFGEIAQAFSYACHRYPDVTMSKAIVIGGGAAIPGIAEHFEKETGVSTSKPTLSSYKDAPQITSALGLSLSWEGQR